MCALRGVQNDVAKSSFWTPKKEKSTSKLKCRWFCFFCTHPYHTLLSALPSTHFCPHENKDSAHHGSLHRSFVIKRESWAIIQVKKIHIKRCHGIVWLIPLLLEWISEVHGLVCHRLPLVDELRCHSWVRYRGTRSCSSSASMLYLRFLLMKNNAESFL